MENEAKRCTDEMEPSLDELKTEESAWDVVDDSNISYQILLATPKPSPPLFASISFRFYAECYALSYANTLLARGTCYEDAQWIVYFLGNDALPTGRPGQMFVSKVGGCSLTGLSDPVDCGSVHTVSFLWSDAFGGVLLVDGKAYTPASHPVSGLLPPPALPHALIPTDSTASTGDCSSSFLPLSVNRVLYTGPSGGRFHSILRSGRVYDIYPGGL